MTLDPRLIAALQRDLPLESHPFRVLAVEAEVTEGELLEALQSAIRQRVVRRYGAIVRHQPLGYQANAMVVWRVPEDRVEEVGQLFSTRYQVSHCYQRPPFADFPYNLYTMVHTQNREQCEALAQEMSAASGVSDYQLLFSLLEFKKTSPVYSIIEEATE